MLPVAALLFDAPRVVHRGADRAEKSQRAPYERHRAGDADAKTAGAERIELIGDEIELAGEILQHELQDGRAIRFVGRDLAEDDEGEEKKGKQRQQRVVSDRRRIREVVAAIEAYEPAPRRDGAQAREFADACHAPIMSGVPGRRPRRSRASPRARRSAGAAAWSA